MMGGTRRDGGPADFGCMSSGLGAGQHRWAIFSYSFSVYGGGAVGGQVNTVAANGVY
jgi:hypothetical protein